MGRAKKTKGWYKIKRLLLPLLMCGSLCRGIYGQYFPQMLKLTEQTHLLQQKKTSSLLISLLTALLIYKYYTYANRSSDQTGNPLALANDERHALLQFLFPTEQDNPLAPTYDERNRLLQLLFPITQEAHPLDLAPANNRPGEQ